MTNVCRPGSAKDLATQKYPKAVCVRICRKNYIVLDRPRFGLTVKIGNGASAELAWHSAIGSVKDKQNYDTD